MLLGAVDCFDMMDLLDLAVGVPWPDVVDRVDMTDLLDVGVGVP